MKSKSIIGVVAVAGILVWLMWPVEALLLSDQEMTHPLKDCIVIARVEANEGPAGLVERFGANAPSQETVAQCTSQVLAAGISLNLPQ